MRRALQYIDRVCEEDEIIDFVQTYIVDRSDAEEAVRISFNDAIAEAVKIVEKKQLNLKEEGLIPCHEKLQDVLTDLKTLRY